MKLTKEFDPEKVERVDHTDTVPGEYVRAVDYDKLRALYREAIPKKEIEYAWECNECGSSEYTMSISEDDLDNLSCGRCGGNEFHKVQVSK